jgi:hypothetical protein
VLPDGSEVPSPFSIGQNEQFVISDVSWVARCTGGCIPGVSGVLDLGRLYISAAAFDSGGSVAAHSDHLSSGIVLSSLPAPILLISAGPVVTWDVVLYGYLVP